MFIHALLLRLRHRRGVISALVAAALLTAVCAPSWGTPNAPSRDPSADARFASALARAPPPGVGAYAPSRLESQWAAHAREWAGELCARIAAERGECRDR